MKLVYKIREDFFCKILWRNIFVDVLRMISFLCGRAYADQFFSVIYCLLIIMIKFDNTNYVIWYFKIHVREMSMDCRFS